MSCAPRNDQAAQCRIDAVHFGVGWVWAFSVIGAISTLHEMRPDVMHDRGADKAFTADGDDGSGP